MKKKMICAIIAVTLCAGVVFPAFAADNAISGNDYPSGVALSDANEASSGGGESGGESESGGENEGGESESESGAVDEVSQALDGAADWAKYELSYALLNGLTLDDMIGSWAKPANRLVAAEVVVKLLEFLTGKTMGDIARENGYDLTDEFMDTINEYASFLKQSGISDGVGGDRYHPEGIFTRAQMVTMLGRMAKTFLGVDTADFPKGSTLFTDVPYWADEFVGWAGDIGITEGTGNGRFNPGGTLSNQQLGILTWRTFARFYKSPYKLLQTGEIITVGQMDKLKAEALSWQSAIAGVGGFAEIVAVEPADGSDQQVYLGLRSFNQQTGEFEYYRGFERMQVEAPDGVKARILSAVSGGGSGELFVGYRMISGAAERVEVFYIYVGDLLEGGQWENITIFQREYVKELSELPPSERQFK